ncbi:esterase/lipase family protein [Mycobacterium interjectum]|uniref:esterase/lipase family protein n=1 Tax=Mycobacterium interjectum TaxID=33895 RepID=UPI0008365F10|nr:alpha/beta fold hydrolase [Mycobacterium interjectum]MCV7091771.1 alpha/beta fold hydrolase [Mycobacterium interjectum]
MQRQEIRSLADLAGEGTGVLTSLVRDTHSGIARRVFGSIGPVSKPVEVVHNATAAATYRAVDGALRAALRGAGELAAEVRGSDDDETVESDPRVAGFIAALNGIYGDELTDRGNGFALTMQLRRHGKPVAMSATDIAEAFPQATGRIAVFVHGWCMTERSWWRRPRDGEEASPYGARLRGELGFTPVYLRYNTGLHISDNGKSLAALIDRLRALWPVPVEEIALIGHSMGGLVARSACHYGTQHQHGWPDSVRHVVCLGSPHLGADLEKGVNAASWALARLPETEGLAAFLNARSVGTKDLRFGALLDEDWSDGDPDEFLRDRCNEVPFLPHAVYHFVATSAGPRPVGAVLGDRLVRPHSASGKGKSRRIPFDPDHGLTLTGLHHFDLLNHAEIYAKLRQWLDQPRAREESSG